MSDQNGQRFLQFPDEYSVGKLFLRSRQTGAWQGRGEARGQNYQLGTDDGEARLHGNEMLLAHLELGKPFQPGIEHLVLDQLPITDDLMERIAGIEGLRTLSLAGAPVTDTALARLGDYQLEGLDLRDTAIGGDGLRYLTKIPSLKSLILNGTDVEDDAVAPLGDLTGLEVLRLGRTGVTSKGFAHLGGLTRLRELELAPRCCELAVAKLAPMTGMRSLFLREMVFRAAALDALSGMKMLNTLALPERLEEPEGIYRLRENRDLRGLWLDCLNMGKNEMWPLSELPKLDWIWIAAPLCAEAVYILGEFPALQKLALVAPNLEREVMIQLRRLAGLKELRLNTSHLDDETVWMLDGLKRLERIILDDSGLTAVGMAHLREVHPNTQIVERPRVLKLPLLMRGRLYTRPSIGAGEEPWRACYRQGEVLATYRDHDYAYHAQETVAREWRAMANDPDFRLVEIKMYACDLEGDVAPCIAGLHHLQTLECTFGRIDLPVFEALPDAPALTTLILDRTNLGDFQANCLAKMPRLESLSARGTAISDTGLRLLANIRTLKQLRLDGARVTEEGLEKLRQARPDIAIEYTPPKPLISGSAEGGRLGRP